MREHLKAQFKAHRDQRQMILTLRNLTSLSLRISRRVRSRMKLVKHPPSKTSLGLKLYRRLKVMHWIVTGLLKVEWVGIRNRLALSLKLGIWNP